MPKSPEELAHQEWLGYVQPVGLVVSIPAMLEAQCYVNKNIAREHAQFLSCLPRDASDEPLPEIRDLREFFTRVLNWEHSDLVEVPQGRLPSAMACLEAVIPQYEDRLLPTHAVPEFISPAEATNNQSLTTNNYVMLLRELPAGTDLDNEAECGFADKWHEKPQAKFERLLRETGIPIGLLSNRRQLRLVYAPKGESSGHATFNVDEMIQVAGRPMFAALHMLLNSERMFSLGDKQRLPAILESSRKYQNTVSTALAEQVLAALYELMRGFQAANDASERRLLADLLGTGDREANHTDTEAQREGKSEPTALAAGDSDSLRLRASVVSSVSPDPNHVYSGLLTVLMRLVFIMYAEDRDLLSSDPVYSNHYSVTGLFNRLREEAGRFPDTMNQRFGAWSQLITLFRLIYEGGQHGEFRLPPRKGYLFDPDRYPFLEGRTYDQPQRHGDTENNLGDSSSVSQWLRGSVPRVSDGIVYNVLRNLLILDGERLSYRTLDVEQIGSVYETVMGFNLEVAKGRSIAIKPVKSHGAPTTINLEALLETKAKDRAKWLKEVSDQKLGTADAKLLKEASNIDELLRALDKKIAKKVTPRIVPAGAIVLQPSDERRRSGSHYTPRSLTEPIVATTLEPILKQLVRHPDALDDNHRDTEAQSEDGEVSQDSQCLRASVVSPRPIDKKLQKRLTKGEIAARERLEQQRADNHTAAIRVGTPHPSQILDLKICDPAMGSGAFLVEACRQLGDELIKAWYAHDAVPTDIPADEDEVLYARRLIAQRCLYGVDKNVMAVDLAKLSLWLVTLAKDHAFTFLDHALRHGDSLVGLTREQIIGFHWEVKKQKKFGEDLIQRRLDRATEARAKILGARDDVPYRDQAARMASADEALDLIRLVGDACVSGFFAGQKKKEREEEVERIYGLASSYLASISGKVVSDKLSVVSKDSDEEPLTTNHYPLTTGGVDFASRQALQAAADRLLEPPHPIPAFHWEIEFPEVFARENGGFDAFVGNPPFAGVVTLSRSTAEQYTPYLREVFPETGGKADLVAFFFRHCFEKLRRTGCLGLIATNTIGQGDTRDSGLRFILKHEGAIFSATSRKKWPGLAAVVVSVVHIQKTPSVANPVLNRRNVRRISAYLLAGDVDDSPLPLHADKVGLVAALGNKPNGKGFIFTDRGTGYLSLANKDALLNEDHRNREVLKPYMGGSELNSNARLETDRWIIDFESRSKEQAATYPKLFALVEERVRPNVSRDKWWQFEHRAVAVQRLLSESEYSEILVIAETSDTFAYAFVPADICFSNKIVIFTTDSRGIFACLQSLIHESWARCVSSTMKDDLSYVPGDCFDTFPFPVDFRCNETLADVGTNYYAAREAFMTTSDLGLTDTYNRFHDPHEQSEGILELRRLHGLMDGAVLRAYGWDDLAESARCEFLLDYEEEEDDADAGPPAAGARKKSKKKKPWRLRWPDEFRDEVLARLLELNEQRHKEELLLAKQSAKAEGEAKKPKKTKPQKPKAKPQDAGLFPTSLDREHRYLLMLLRLWEGRSVSRRVLNAGMILMLDDSLRASVLSNGNVSSGNKKSSTTINQVFTDLEIDGFIEQVDSEHQALWRITEAAPETEPSVDDQNRVEEVLEFLNREREAGKVTISEEVVDADIDLIPA